MIVPQIRSGALNLNFINKKVPERSEEDSVPFLQEKEKITVIFELHSAVCGCASTVVIWKSFDCKIAFHLFVADFGGCHYKSVQLNATLIPWVV